MFALAEGHATKPSSHKSQKNIYVHYIFALLNFSTAIGMPK